ncbi:MAG: hypothetical protein H7X99_04295 [Saprospiraceae bacterium]|nr:hypothetical protein [Saprospiraceae bacterium]
MKTNLVKFQWLFILALGLFGTSCSDTSDSIDDATAETYAEETVFRTQEAANLGRFGCYELVFPVTVAFPDGSTAEADSYEALKLVVKNWRKDNPRVRIRPSFAFPYEVINKDGEVITVEDATQQKELRIACGKDFFGTHGPAGHNDRPKLCFRPAFPFSIELPDGTIVTLNSKEDKRKLQLAIREWKKNNPDSTEKPELVFPLSVILEDRTTVIVNSKEELLALKESCK